MRARRARRAHVTRVEAGVVAVDQSERMVELTAARGVEAVVADAQDCRSMTGPSIASLQRGCSTTYRISRQTLRELRRVLRPDGRLVAATSSESNLGELWQLVGEHGAPAGGFTVENAEGTLFAPFHDVERRDVRGTVTSPTARPPTATSRRARPAVSSPTACRSSTAHSPRPVTSPSSCAICDQARELIERKREERSSAPRSLPSSYSATRAATCPTTRCPHFSWPCASRVCPEPRRLR